MFGSCRSITLEILYFLHISFSYSPNPIVGFLDDYAFVIRGLLDLYEASLDVDWLQWAELLQEHQDRMFWDQKKSGYFTSPEGDTSILIRGKEGIHINRFDYANNSLFVD